MLVTNPILYFVCFFYNSNIEQIQSFSLLQMLQLKSYHGWVEQDENSRPHQSSGAQKVRSVQQTQHSHKGPPRQQAAHRHCFIQPLAVTGADIDQLGRETAIYITNDIKTIQWTKSSNKTYWNLTTKTIKAILQKTVVLLPTFTCWTAIPLKLCND